MSHIDSATPRLFVSPQTQPLAKAVQDGFGVATSVSTQEIHRLTDKVFATVRDRSAGDAAMSKAGSLGAGAPELQEPNMEKVRQALGTRAEGLTAEAMLLLLLGELQQLIETSSLETMQRKLKLFIERADTARVAGEQLSGALAKAEAEALDLAERAQSAVGEATEAGAAAEGARDEVQRLREQLNGMDPASPEYQALSETLAKQETMAGELAIKEKTALDAAIKASDAAMKEVHTLEQEARRLSGPTDLVPPPSQTKLTAAAKLSELMAMLSDLVATATRNNMESQLDFTLKNIQSREAQNKKSSEEFQEQVEKAKDAEKKMGCIGKWVGWVITVVAVVAAPFSGGASLAFAAVGLALAITEEVTGFSLIGKMVEPIMTKVMPLLVKALSGVMEKILGAIPGIDDAAAKKYGTIIGAVAAAVVAVAVVAVAVILGKGAGAKIASKIGPALTKNLGKIVPNVLKQVGKKLSTASASAAKWAGSATGLSKTDVVTRATYVQGASQIGQTVSTVGLATGQVFVADLNRKAQDTLADLNLGIFGMDELKRVIDDIYERFSEGMDFASQLILQVVESGTSALQTARSVVGRV